MATSYELLLKERDELQREANTANAELFAVLKQSEYRSADEIALVNSSVSRWISPHTSIIMDFTLHILRLLIRSFPASEGILANPPFNPVLRLSGLSIWSLLCAAAQPLQVRTQAYQYCDFVCLMSSACPCI